MMGRLEVESVVPAAYSRDLRNILRISIDTGGSGVARMVYDETAIWANPPDSSTE